MAELEGSADKKREKAKKRLGRVWQEKEAGPLGSRFFKKSIPAQRESATMRLQLRAGKQDPGASRVSGEGELREGPPSEVPRRIVARSVAHPRYSEPLVRMPGRQPENGLASDPFHFRMMHARHIRFIRSAASGAAVIKPAACPSFP